ncbi:uncharacterized protein G2W53_023483 [Senna tora]|uniref:Uncharacterized protein n=1 Tax=Senna tora TaxID=362788 RepID=A0A834WEI8_9FABA|nr:uncharacterized protein G2W53_023483 [Senna tora]
MGNWESFVFTVQLLKIHQIFDNAIDEGEGLSGLAGFSRVFLHDATSCVTSKWRRI